MITIENLSRVFRLPHEKKSTLRQRFVGLFHKGGYEKFYALQDINLQINQGEFIGIIGKNGSGKSTLLKIIARVLRPSSGQVSVLGAVAPFLELSVGFQDDLTVKDNIFLYGALLGMSRKQIIDKYDWIIEFSGLERFIDAKLKNLSSGMQVRLGFSVTISLESRILLVDEVLAVGDIDFQEKCYNCFEGFKKKGLTIVYVSHNLQTVEQFADRAVLLEKGRIKKIGPARSVLDYYRQISASSKTQAEKI